MTNIWYIYKSLWLSFIYRRRDFFKVPIRSSWITKIKAAKNSEIRTEGLLFLGLFKGIGQVKYDRTVIELEDNAKLITGNNVSIGPGVRILIRSNAVLEIGSNTYITANSTIICTESIRIGNDCMISWDVQIMDSDIHQFNVNNKKINITQPIVIEDKVWVGARASILKGVKIESGSIVASGANVTKSVGNNIIVAGNPAKIIKEKVKWIK